MIFNEYSIPALIRLSFLTAVFSFLLGLSSFAAMYQMYGPSIIEEHNIRVGLRQQCKEKFMGYRVGDITEPCYSILYQ